VKVTVSDIGTFNPLTDTTRVCGTTTTLDAGAGYTNYSWNTGATTQTITVTSGGVYKVTVTNAAGCTASDSTLLSLVSANIINNDTTICKGIPIVLNINSICSKYNGMPMDASGNSYDTVRINGITWMKKNLTTSKYSNGDPIPEVQNASSWSIQGPGGTYGGSTIPLPGNGAWCNYDNDITKGQIYGKLYNLYAINDSRGICPLGWRVPTYLETKSLGSDLVVGGNIKSTGNLQSGTGLWASPNVGNWPFAEAHDPYGFTLLPAGRRMQNGQFVELGLSAWFGFVSQGLLQYRNINTYVNGYTTGAIDYNQGYSVRCIKTATAQSNIACPNIIWSTGATTNSITVNPTQTTTYYCTVSDGITSCIDSVKVTVVSVDTAVTALDPTAICSATGGQVRLQANATGVTYQWLFNGNPISNSNIRIYTATQSGAYRVVITNTLGCKDTSRIISINLVQTPTVNSISNKTICNGGVNSLITISGSVAGAVYNWTNNTPSIGLGASGIGNIPAFTAVNTGTTPITASITITPNNTVSGLTCTGTPITFTITVNPSPTVNTVTNQTVCNNGNTNAINFSGSIIGTSFNWTNNTPSIGLAASGTGNIASFVATNTTANPITATITVTPTFTNAGLSCTGTANTFTITVNPTPTATVVNPVTSIICQGSSVTLTANGGSTYQWYLNGILIAGATASIALTAPVADGRKNINMAPSPLPH
jgi:uncharacterized protein (TIGR02145 family)